MSCKLCQAYLHDYFHQPLQKENPIAKNVQHKKLISKIPELTDLTLRLLFTMKDKIIDEADGDLHRYITFISKPDDMYHQYDLYTLFLKKDKKFCDEFQSSEAALWEFDFLKIPKNDIKGHIHRRWLSFLVGSLLKELYSLHKDHSKKHDLWHYNLNQHLPGRPETAPKLRKNIKDNTAVYRNKDKEKDDLYF